MDNGAGIGPVVPRALDVLRRGEAAAIVTILADRSPLGLQPGARLFVPETGDAGGLHQAADAALVADAREVLAQRKPGVRSYTVRPEGVVPAGMQGGDLDVFVEVLERPPRLVIVGAGHIAVPLARLAKLLDFDVWVLDDRPEYSNRERFPDADQVLVGPYRETLAGVPLHGDTHVVLVTRGHVHDQACLEQVLGSNVAYIGMIGSQRRVRTVMQHLADKGYPVERLQRVYAPVGLDIGAQTPAEIALSIMGEIVSLRRGGRAVSLALQERLRVL